MCYRKHRNEKKELDLSKPLTAGAFVDTQKIQELHDTLSQQLPPEPPMAWLLAEKEKMENVRELCIRSLHIVYEISVLYERNIVIISFSFFCKINQSMH